MPAYIGYAASEEARQENGLNGIVIASAADAGAAVAAAKSNKVNGSTSNEKLDLWTFVQVQAGALTLPGSAAVIWTDGFHTLGKSGRAV